MNCSVYATLAHVGLGTFITIHAGTTPNHSGKFLGIQHGNVVIVSNGGTIFYYPVDRIDVIHIP
ncbi:hypothetical protein A8709_22570 [Paenibacillus pectinilyticus]|uniref:DUF2642 domain-containing protein n=1 Tax=Paenibacillus pectinilyticus TaxID=512399 RepID=A0A1C0ZRE5_9BACL|nr:hypothetical protein [Paenibacillus pectinilyticus]OCT10630.1 hypothetical protein A8709_22570 [Paenibacillus pectinilyticus]